MTATPKQPADGDQASHPGLPSCPAACTHLQKAQDHEYDQDRHLIDVGYDLCDALENLGSSVAHERAEGHEAVRRTLRIWLKHRADGAHSEPEFLVHRLQRGYTKEEFSSDKLEEQDRATLCCLKDMSADLGLKVLLVFWTLMDFVELEENFKDHCEVLHNVPASASKEWHTRHRLLSSRVNVEKLVDLDDIELDLRRKYVPIAGRADLAKHLIQKDGDIFYDTCAMRWERDLASDGRSRDDYTTHFNMEPGSSPSASKRATATQCYQSCAVLLVPRDKIDCFLLGRIPPGSARDAIPQYLDQCMIPETRSRASRTLRHLVKKAHSTWATLHGGDAGIRIRVVKAALDNLDYLLFDHVVDELVLDKDLDGSKSVFEAVHKAIAENPDFKFAEISPSLLALFEGLFKDVEGVVEGIVALLWVLAPTGGGVPVHHDVLSWILETVGPWLLRISREGDPTTPTKSPQGQAIVDLVVRYYPVASFKRSSIVSILAPFSDRESFMLGALARIDRYVDEGAYGRQEGRAIYQRLAESTVKAMHLSLLFTGNGKTLALPDARHLAALLNNCLKYQWEDLSESLIGMATSQLYEAEVSDMQEFWVSGFLLPLIHLLPDCKTESSPQPGTPRQQTSAQSLVQLIVRQYLHLLIGRKPLASAQDYWRDPARCTNHCKLCDELNSFLQSQRQARGFQYIAGTDYDHMASQIEGCEYCKFISEPVSRDGRDQFILLVVTKTAQTFEQRKACWEARLATAREFVAKLKEQPLQARLEVLFGGGRCDSIIDIDLRNPFKMQQGTVHWQRQGDPILPLDYPLFPERGSNFLPALAGRKRKAEDQGQR